MRSVWSVRGRTAVVLVTAASLRLLVVGAARPAPAQSAPDPFAFFRPSVTLDGSDLADLSRGDVVVRTLPDEPGEVAVFLAVRTTADADHLTRWMRHIAALKKSEHVLEIARFSDPPRLDDLHALEFDADDVETARRCHPGSCDLKLTADEMTRLRQTAQSAGSTWRQAVGDGLRQVLLDRVSHYLAEGQRNVAPYVDQSKPAGRDAAFTRILQHSPFLEAHAPALARYLAQYPDAPADDVESFVYWSKEQPSGRPQVTATHVAMLAPRAAELPEVLVAGRQIFATHYVLGSLSVTALVRGPAGERYLAYLNRTHVDILDRWFAGLARGIMKRRLRNEAKTVFAALKARVESEPPGD